MKNKDLVLAGQIPPDARVVVEMGYSNETIRATIKSLNPTMEYFSIAAEGCTAIEPYVWTGNLATADIKQVAGGMADCLVYNHVLEQLDQAGAALRRQVEAVNDGGIVIAAVANGQYWRNIAGLLRGNWYQQNKLITLDAIQNMFSQAGLTIFDVQVQNRKEDEFAEFQRHIGPLIKQWGLDERQTIARLSAERYIIRAVKSPSKTPPNRLLVQTLLISKIASDSIRVYEPDRFLRTIPGVRTLSAFGTANLNASLPGEDKVFIWQRQRMKYPDDLQKQRELLRRGYLVVAEIDDDPMFWPEHPENNFITFRSSHCIQTSTEYLADILREFNPNIAVFPNQLLYLPPARIYAENKPLTIFFGAFNREQDWEPIMPELNRVLAQYIGRVRVKVVYDQQFFDALQFQDKEFEPLCSYQRYHAILHSMDIALLPLRNTRFNSAKSDLKFLQCAGHGVTVLASPTVYEHSIIDKQTGMLYWSAGEFAEKLGLLIEDNALRQRLAANAYSWVAENRMLYQHYRERREWYLSMLKQLPRLTAELYERVPELSKI